MKKIQDLALCNIGENCIIEPDTIIGYIPDRNIKNLQLNIGKNAYIRSKSLIYLGSTIGDNLQTGHNVIIREENNIGNNFNIWSNTVIDYGCEIGNNVKIHCNCYIAQFTVIEDYVFIAPGVIIANDYHPGCKRSKHCMKGPLIKQNVKIGVNVTILPYVEIGKNSLIAAGSVVTKNIPPDSVVVGNPAEVVKNIKDLSCRTGLIDKPY